LGPEASAGSGGEAIDVVIVSYRCEPLLRDCLSSLREHPGSRPITVQVIDNASGDGTAEMVEREFPDLKLTVNARNAGFAAAANQGIAAGEAPFVLALNPDCELREGTLDGLLAVMDERRDVGICGPALIRPGGRPDHAAKRGFPTPLNSLGYFTGIGRRRRGPAPLRGYASPDPSRGGQVDAVNGAFMLIRRAMLDQIGVFDEGYWMYMEDLDLCYRARRAGWLTWYEPATVAIHLKGGSSGPSRGLRLNYAFHRGMYRFYRKHYAAGRSSATNSVVYAGIAAKLALSSVRGGVRRLLRTDSHGSPGRRD
jgi:N-acetylglucosaminyl-diphospho-decaprenol L-rhamnosyltransferase